MGAAAEGGGYFGADLQDLGTDGTWAKEGSEDGGCQLQAVGEALSAAQAGLGGALPTFRGRPEPCEHTGCDTELQPSAQGGDVGGATAPPSAGARSVSGAFLQHLVPPFTGHSLLNASGLLVSFSSHMDFPAVAPIFNLFNEISFPVIPETGNL